MFVFQTLALATVFWFGWTLFHNTLNNMESRGISTGFGFLDQTSGFGIIMSLVPYDSTMTYGRTFLVGLLNTLLVSAMGVVAATIIGFAVGVARLSSNWLIAKLALVYIETIRNIPLLLQIFFWYFAVLQTLPSPRQSLDVADMFFLSNRGLYFPTASAEPGFGWVIAALTVSITASVFVHRWLRSASSARANYFRLYGSEQC